VGRHGQDNKSKETVGLLRSEVGWRVSIAKITVSSCSHFHLQQCGEDSDAPVMQNGGRGDRKTR
jgi:hypothetical protein